MGHGGGHDGECGFSTCMNERTNGCVSCIVVGKFERLAPFPSLLERSRVQIRVMRMGGDATQRSGSSRTSE